MSKKSPSAGVWNGFIQKSVCQAQIDCYLFAWRLIVGEGKFMVKEYGLRGWE